MISTTNLVRELLHQIRLGEDSAYEFKALTIKGNKVEQPHRSGVADELAAFANSGGGFLVLGVNDKTHELEGIALDKLNVVDQWLTNIAQQAIEPPLPIEMRRVEVPDQRGEAKPVIWVRVRKSLFVHKSPHGYFHRADSSKREMPTDLPARLLQQRSQARLIRFDEQWVPNAEMEAIDPALETRFLRDGFPRRMQLEKLHLLARDSDASDTDADDGQSSARYKLTVSGVLLLTPRPPDYLSSAYIQCVAYSGTERNVEYQLDAQDCDGPLDQQVQQAFSFVKRNMRVEAVKRPGRIDIPQYDLHAVYEAIVNAVAHRDYSIYGSRIRLHLGCRNIGFFPVFSPPSF